MGHVARARLASVVVYLAASAAHAQEDSEKKAAANALFDEGRALMAAGDTARACAKFDASVKVLGQLGARLNLAACYEKIGRLASAWAEFREAASQAARSGDPREQEARQHVASLEPRLSRLTIRLRPGATVLELRVTRDGVVVVPATLDSAVPVDPGEHVIAATAPGYRPWESKVAVPPEKASVVVEIPELEKLPDTPTVVVTPGGAAAPATPAPADDPGRTRRFIGLGVGGAGVALVATGLVFGLRAGSKFDDAKKNGCDDDGLCDGPKGLDLLDQAHSAAGVSTILTIAGGVAIAGGVVLFLTAPRRPERTALRVTPAVGAGFVGVVAGGAL